MTREELQEIITSLCDVQADTTHVEIKSCAGGFPKRIWESISAFTNTPGGGVIILGVSETEKGIEITGVKNPAHFQKDLASLCDQMAPPLRALIEIHKYEGKNLVTVEVPEVSYKEKPCFYKGAGVMSGSFIRVADGDRQLTQYEVQGFLDGRGQPLYDIEPVADSSREDLDKELVSLFLQNVREKLPKVEAWDDKKILNTCRIVADCKNKECLTLAGLLCLGEYPQKFFPGLVLHILVYPAKSPIQQGEFGERLMDNIKIEGSLIRAVPEAIKAIKRNLQKRAFVKGLFREDVLEYPEIFLREAVINALGHRDYAPLARGTAVQIKIFPDRIEISNPGGLFGPVTEERLGEQGLQATRNAYLMKLLEDIPVPGEKQVLCENRGTGISAMIASLIKAGMEPPQFKDLRNQFRVICSNQALFDKDTLLWFQKYADVELSDRQRFALAYIRHKERLTNSEYCRMNDCDSRIASRELNELTARRIIQQHGSRRWTYYTIWGAEKTVLRAPAKRKDRRDELMDVIKMNQPVSRRQIQERLHLSAPAILYWLRRLLKEGKIKVTTASAKDRKAKYIIKKIKDNNNASSR